MEQSCRHRSLSILPRLRPSPDSASADLLTSIANTYRPSAAFDPHEQVVFTEISDRGGPIAFSRIRANERQSDGTRIYEVAGQVLPPWRRLGLGGALLAHSEMRLRQIATTQPTKSRRFFGSYAFDTQIGNLALLESRGYAQTRELESHTMVRPTLDGAPAAPLPPGLEVRSVGPEHKRQIWDLYQQCDADELGATPGTEDDYAQWASSPFWDESMWQVAWDGDQPVGMVLNFIQPDENARYGRERGYTEYINVARPWRRRGVARSLIVGSFGVLKRAGMTEAALGVYVHNPTGAHHLYESLGYRAVQSRFTYRRPMDARPA